MISADAASAHGFLARISRTRSISGGSRLVLKPAPAQALDAQPVGDGERREVVLELRGRLHLVAHHLVEALQPGDLVVQVLLEELLQPRQLEAVAQPDHLADLGGPVDARVKADRAVDLAGEVVEHPAHRREDRPRDRGPWWRCASGARPWRR